MFWPYCLLLLSFICDICDVLTVTECFYRTSYSFLFGCYYFLLHVNLFGLFVGDSLAYSLYFLLVLIKLLAYPEKKKRHHICLATFNFVRIIFYGNVDSTGAFHVVSMSIKLSQIIREDLNCHINLFKDHFNYILDMVFAYIINSSISWIIP